MGKRFTITEQEKKQIRLLYEQQSEVNPQIQGVFKYSHQGLNPYVVIDINGMNSEQIFNSTINWIKETFRNPDKVIKMSIPNQKIRFETSANVGQVKNVVFPYLITIEISIKDNKLKFEPIETINPAVPETIQDYSLIGFPNNIPEEGLKQGPIRIKKEKVIEHMSQTMMNLERYLNELTVKLSNSFKKRSDDW
jgi:hypothetical protein